MYKVTVTYCKPDNRTCEQTSTYFSWFSAHYLADKFAKCADVLLVHVWNAETGEILLTYDHGDLEYIAECGY